MDSKSVCWNPKSQGDGIRRWGSGEWLGQREPRELPPSFTPCEDTARRYHLRTRKQALTRHCQRWSWTSQPLEQRSKCFLLQPPSLWCFCYSSVTGQRQLQPSHLFQKNIPSTVLYRNVFMSGPMHRPQGQTHQGQGAGMDTWSNCPDGKARYQGPSRKPLPVCPHLFLLPGLNPGSVNLHNSPERYSSRPGREALKNRLIPVLVLSRPYFILYSVIYSLILPIKMYWYLLCLNIRRASFIEHLLSA